MATAKAMLRGKKSLYILLIHFANIGFIPTQNFPSLEIFKG